MRTSKVYSVSDEEFKDIIKNANSYSDCMRALGLTTRGGSSTERLKQRIEELECSIKHFGQLNNGKNANAKYDLDEILIENSPYQNTTRLKERIIREGRLEYKCEQCGNTGE